MNDTKQKILDTAAELFAEDGYSATSLRRVIAKAGVNLAAVHYHFGTKQDLLDQIITQKISSLNGRRIELLDQFEAEAAPEPLSIEKVVEAFLTPAVLMAPGSGFVRLMARLHAEKSAMEVILRNFQPLFERYTSALRRALPGMSEVEIAWKVHFMLGSMSHTLLVTPWLSPEAAAEPARVIVKRLVTFVTSGFLAPVAVENIRVKAYP